MKALVSLLCCASITLAAESPDRKLKPSETATPVVKLILPPSDRDYLWTMIACAENEERHVDQLYDSYLFIAEKKELPQGHFRVPRHFAREDEGYFLFDRVYYVTPNTLRGFILVIPKDCVAIKDDMIEPACPLVVSSWDRRQGQQIAVLKRQAPIDTSPKK